MILLMSGQIAQMGNLEEIERRW